MLWGYSYTNQHVFGFVASHGGFTPIGVVAASQKQRVFFSAKLGRMVTDKRGTFSSETRGSWATGQAHVPQQTCGFWPAEKGGEPIHLL